MSGPVRTPDEMLPADAASGAGRTPAGRPVVSQFEYLKLQVEGNAPRTQADHELYYRWRSHDPDLVLMETAREHVRNALQLLNVFDHAYRMDQKLYYVYDGADIEAVVARLRKALGE